MIMVSILGTGNVAKKLCEGWMSAKEVEVAQVIGRNETALKTFGNRIPASSDFSKIGDADVYIMAVNDDAIATVSEYLRNKKGLVVHTSGSVSMDVLSEHGRYGVLYPLQTFSQDRKMDMESVPFCLEAYHRADMELLKKLAGTLSEEIQEVDSEQRKSLHLAAVFVNNFTNYLYHIGREICEEMGLPFGMLHPLIRETVDKIGNLKPYDAQTGPARRGDSETIKRHLKQLENTDYQKVYEVMSQSILNLYEQPYS